MRSKLVLISAMLVLSLFAASPALAKGPSGGGGGNKSCHKNCGTTGTATLVVSPNPVPANSTFQISGCGYYVAPDVGVLFILTTNAGTAMWSASVDSSGCLVNANGWAGAPSSATLEAVQYFNGTTNIMATTTFMIQ